MPSGNDGLCSADLCGTSSVLYLWLLTFWLRSFEHPRSGGLLIVLLFPAIMYAALNELQRLKKGWRTFDFVRAFRLWRSKMIKIFYVGVESKKACRGWQITNWRTKLSGWPFWHLNIFLEPFLLRNARAPPFTPTGALPGKGNVPAPCSDLREQWKKKHVCTNSILSSSDASYDLGDREPYAVLRAVFQF